MKKKQTKTTVEQYKNEYAGHVEICPGKHCNLQISWDYDNDLDDKQNRTAVLLWTPHMEKSDHEHIVMNRKQATILRDWLNEYLRDI